MKWMLLILGSLIGAGYASVEIGELSGSVASCFHAKFGKYCSAVRPFTVNLPEPARRKTRATDSLRRPVPRIHVCLPTRGEPVELKRSS